MKKYIIALVCIVVLSFVYEQSCMMFGLFLLPGMPIYRSRNLHSIYRHSCMTVRSEVPLYVLQQRLDEERIKIGMNQK
jgi:hypothetical protein